MESYAGEQGLALLQLFPCKSSYLILNSNRHEILFFNARGFILAHCDVFNMFFPLFFCILKVAAHNFMKSRSHDGLAAKGLLLSPVVDA